MKKIISLVLTIIAMIVLPLIVVFFVGGVDALGILMLLYFTINPITSIVIGIINANDKAKWLLPLINAIVFLISTSIITGFDISYIIVAVLYAGLGIAAAYITALIKNKNNQSQ